MKPIRSYSIESKKELSGSRPDNGGPDGDGEFGSNNGQEGLNPELSNNSTPRTAPPPNQLLYRKKLRHKRKENSEGRERGSPEKARETLTKNSVGAKNQSSNGEGHAAAGTAASLDSLDAEQNFPGGEERVPQPVQSTAFQTKNGFNAAFLEAIGADHSYGQKLMLRQRLMEQMIMAMKRGLIPG